MKTIFRTVRWVILTSAIGLCAGPFVHAQTEPGVIVEQVSKDLEAESGGIQEGDVLLRWVCGSSKGEIKSPFDLSAAEIEQAPRCAITIEGYRGAEKRVWTLGPGRWGTETRPAMTERLLSVYRQGQELAKNGKSTEAAESWIRAADEAANSESGTLASWLLFQAARALVNAHQWTPADAVYEKSVSRASGAGATIRGQLFRAWAASHEQRADWPDAEKYNRQAVAESRGPGSDSLLTAWCLFGLGNMFRLRADFDKAEQYLGESLEIRRQQAPGSLPVAAALNNLGFISQDRGNLDKADQEFSEALEIRQKRAPNSLDVAASFNNLGSLAQDRGDLDKAEQYHLGALAINEKLAPDSLNIAYNFSNLGNVAFERGDSSLAETYIRRALEIRKNLSPDSPEVAENLGNLGSIRWQRGDLAGAEEYYRETLEIVQKIAPGGLDTASILDNLGNVAFGQRDFAKARRYHNQALLIRQKLAPGGLDVGRTFNNLGNLEEEEGNLARAASYYRRALVIQQKLAPDSLIVGVSLSSLGTIAWKRGDLFTADRYYVRALDIEEKLAPDSLDTSQTLERRGDIARARNKLDLAEQLYRQALATQEKLAPDSVLFAESLAAIGSVVKERGRLSEAAQLYEESLNALENQINRLGGTDNLRADFRAKYARYYLQYIDVLMAQGKPELAFYVSERLRSRSLLEELAAGHVDIHKGADPDLLDRERVLEQSLKAKSDRRVVLLTGKHTEKQIEALQTEIEQLRTEYQHLEDRIRAGSPAYAALTRPQPLTAKEVQQLLDESTVLLEYTLGEERSYLWVVSQRSVRAHQLPRQSRIQSMARRLHRLASSTTGTLLLNGKTKAGEPGTLETAVSELSRMLMTPAAEEIRGRRLLIVSDGALQYIPFAALPVPGRSKGVPMVVEHEIVQAPSASVLAELRHEAMARTQAPKAIAIFADPVFDKNDPRVERSGRKANHQTSMTPDQLASWPKERVARSVADVGLVDLSRLAFSRREAEAIVRVTPAGQAKEALGFDANRAAVTSQELAQYRIVHFATHALSDNKRPELSGLILSLVDQKGSPQNGFLDLQDIYNLNLAAELVVLSGCETALGKEIRGEGLIGLTRGFMYAGATRVLASLWKVDDVATSELMWAFYKAMEQGGMPPAAALRQAQIYMWRQKRWSQPYYWAGFQLQGEWR